MPKVHANGIDIHYEIIGSGEPLLLIAGLGYGHWMWHKMIPGLVRVTDTRKHFQVIAFDNRGAGQTDKPDGPYNVQMMADDTAGLLDALEIKGAVVMGHSMGGFIAQQLVLDRPDLVSKLILSATNFGGPNHIPVTPEAMAVILDRSGDPVDVIKRGIAVACAPGFIEMHPEIVEELITYRLTDPVPLAQYQAQTAIGLELMNAEAAFEHKLEGVRVPTLILFGEHDLVVPPGNAELLAQRIVDSTTVIIPDAGHLFPIERPEAAAGAVVEFLRG
jgi:pimeloyl-ACP methyl ester carboxylesterase